jgi:hypothetical protein
MDTKKKRLTLDLDPPLQRRLKAVTALQGISMRQYCQTAIEKELTKDEAQGLTALPFKVVLNPLDHAGASSITKAEVDAAIKAVEGLSFT